MRVFFLKKSTNKCFLDILCSLQNSRKWKRRIRTNKRQRVNNIFSNVKQFEISYSSIFFHEESKIWPKIIFTLSNYQICISYLTIAAILINILYLYLISPMHMIILCLTQLTESVFNAMEDHFPEYMYHPNRISVQNLT